jgi:hypothetical protein
LIDIDGDGDTEFVSAEVDFGVGNLTRAMLTQKNKGGRSVSKDDERSLFGGQVLAQRGGSGRK